MPSQSPQSIAIQTANAYLDIVDQILTIYSELRDLNAIAVDNNVAAVLGKMQTVAVNPDGSLATVEDAQIITANPISPRLYPTFNRPVSLTQLAQAKTILDGLIEYVEGRAVTTQIGARAILHAVHGG